MSSQMDSSSNPPKSVKSDIPGIPAGIPTSIPTNPADLAKMANMNPAAMNPAALSSIALNTVPPTPAQVVLDYLLFTLYSLVGTLIYYPSLIVNLPESTLEESLPKQDLCMKMGFSERICKKKIKCLFKNCNYLDDPIGYKLDKQFKKPCNRKRRTRDVTNKNIMVGGKNKTRKYPEKLGWRRYLSKNMKKQLKNEYKTNISNFISNKTKIKQNRRTKKYHGGNNKNILNPDTCKNKKTKVFCSLRNGDVVYPEPLILSETLQKKNELLKLFGGGNQNAAKSEKPDELVKEDTDLKNPMTPQSNEEKIKSIILEKIKTHNEDLFKVIENNPEHVNKIIYDFKSKNPIISKMLFKFPETIEKYSDKLIPFIKNVPIDNFKMSSQPVNRVQHVDVPSTSQNDNIETIVGNPEEDEKERKLMIKSFFIEKIKTKTLFKLAIVIKAIEHLFANEKLTVPRMNRDTTSSAENEVISVVFPWKFNDPNMRLSDKIKCMSAHITQTKFEREQDPDLYDKCFVCKHCTLRNTSSKVWGGVIKGLLSGNKSKQFVTLINNVFGMLQKHLHFPLMTDKQYYLTTLISLQLVHENLKIDQIDSVFYKKGAKGNKFKLKDLMLGIPPISFIDETSLHDYRDELRQCYINFHHIGIVEGINGIYYESVFKKYFKMDQHDKNEKLEYLKNIALQNYELLYNKSAYSKNQSQEIFVKIYDNKINTKDMENFSHFETSLKDIKYSTDYKSINNYLTNFLQPQYQFLLDSNNFQYNNLINNANMYNNNSNENKVIDPSLKVVTMKLF